MSQVYVGNSSNPVNFPEVTVLVSFCRPDVDIAVVPIRQDWSKELT